MAQAMAMPASTSISESTAARARTDFMRSRNTCSKFWSRRSVA